MRCQQNVGGIDRLARIVLGLALLGSMFAGLIGVWGWVGLIPLATGLLKFCPLYGWLGINSCQGCAKKESQ
ncbi:YgaP family membrane protein [Parvibium lacunae]|uniref:DUF2892 domain-containing protein n=1 Tax=Parvibium lacunae TaxID=1888893 RepID=A0A368L3V6_9BURK|nr:DUF2892 domain-containing protein [Parvibium lacunae]RCS58163.1 DUF2892 domain-containing protein [Parvibium lacunae]